LGYVWVLVVSVGLVRKSLGLGEKGAWSGFLKGGFFGNAYMGGIFLRGFDSDFGCGELC
jgi:hypothetical protein